jgi:hypothetical protein
MERITASERTRERLKAVMDGEGEVADGRSELVRLAARIAPLLARPRRTRGFPAAGGI